MLRRSGRLVSKQQAEDALLASLPQDLLQCVFEQSTAEDLARWALTSAKWAHRIAPVLLAHWQRMADAMSEHNKVSSFDGLAQLIQRFSCDRIVTVVARVEGLDRNRSHPSKSPFEVTIDDFKTEQRFRRLHERVKGEIFHAYEVSQVFRRLPEDTASDAQARLACAKKIFHVKSGPWFGSRYGSGEERLVAATAIRLVPSEFLDVVKSWTAAYPAHIHDVRGATTVPCLVGEALHRSLTRSKWETPDLTALLQLVTSHEKEIFIEKAEEDLAVHVIISSLPQDVKFAAAEAWKPPKEPDSQRFWFELLCCEIEEQPFFCHSYDDDEVKRHAERLSPLALDALIDITVDEEQEYERNSDYRAERGATVHDVTTLILRTWASAHGFPAGCPSHKRAAFVGILHSLPSESIDELARDAFSWIRGCRGLPWAAVKSLCDVFQRDED